MLYPNTCYNEVCYKGTALYIYIQVSVNPTYCTRNGQNNGGLSITSTNGSKSIEYVLMTEIPL